MGTLFSQQPRNSFRVSREELEGFLVTARELAKKFEIDLRDVIAANHVLELERQNDLRYANGDIFDEQMSGLGGILQEIASNLQDVYEPK